MCSDPVRPSAAWSVAVDGRAGDAELGGDLGGGLLAHAGPVELVIHLLRELGLRSELGSLPAGAAAGSGGLRAAPSHVGVHSH
jgi:hypothetical protein